MTISLYRRPVYYYQNGKGPENCFYYFGEPEGKNFIFTVDNNRGTSRVLSADASFDRYSASAKLMLTPVGATAWVSMTGSDTWKRAMAKDGCGETKTSGVEYVLTYSVYVDGVSQPGWLEEGGQTFRGSFKTSSDAKEIVFRPCIRSVENTRRRKSLSR